MSDIEAAIELLKQKESTTRCSELISILKQFDFECNKRKSGNHYTYKHNKYTSIANSFDGGHGKDAVIKSYGIRGARNALDALKEQIEFTNDNTQTKKFEPKQLEHK